MILSVNSFLCRWSSECNNLQFNAPTIWCIWLSIHTHRQLLFFIVLKWIAFVITNGLKEQKCCWQFFYGKCGTKWQTNFVSFGKRSLLLGFFYELSFHIFCIFGITFFQELQRGSLIFIWLTQRQRFHLISWPLKLKKHERPRWTSRSVTPASRRTKHSVSQKGKLLWNR